MQMQERINKRLDKKMQISDLNLTERFIDGVKDRITRQDLRKFVLDKGSLPFQEFRLRMLRWIEDNPVGNVDLSVQKTTCTSVSNSEISELVTLVKKQQDILEGQQKQIDELTRMCHGRSGKSSTQQQEIRDKSKQQFGSKSNRGRNERQEGHSGAKGRKCYNCGGFGHIAAHCPSEKKSTSESRPSSGNPNWNPSQ
jgi:hypothetical protein